MASETQPGVRATIVGSLPKPGWLAKPGSLALRSAHTKNSYSHPSPASSQARKGTFYCWADSLMMG